MAYPLVLVPKPVDPTFPESTKGGNYSIVDQTIVCFFTRLNVASKTPVPSRKIPKLLKMSGSVEDTESRYVIPLKAKARTARYVDTLIRVSRTILNLDR